MAQVDILLKRVFAWAILLIIITSGIVAYVHFNSQYRRAQREVIYLKAREQSMRERQQRLLEYEKRMQEQKLRREYNQGRVAGQAQSSVLN